MKRFMVRQLQKGEHNDDGIYLTDRYYWFITLDSGEVVALRYDPDMDTDFYDSTQDIWYSPVGTWRPWELTEQERAILTREAPELTTTADPGQLRWAVLAAGVRRPAGVSGGPLAAGSEAQGDLGRGQPAEK